MKFQPSYIELFNSGELKSRAEKTFGSLGNCRSCPHDCRVNRFNKEVGICASGFMPIVSSYTPHFGEEPVLSGTRGAGNIFFGNCNLKCIYCQNYEISQNRNREILNEVSNERLAEIMLELQERGCHNIGLVSPTHFSASILKSIYMAAERGLNLPIIYNTNGYDSVEMLKEYDGIIGVYLPDFKYGDDEYAKKYSYAENYFDITKQAVKEMHRQVGGKLMYNNGVVVRGLIIRHLVLPNGLSESEKVFRFIADELGSNVHISLMSQYYPTNNAYKEILLNRILRLREYEKAVELLHKYNLNNGWAQEPESSEFYRPEFQKDRINPFNN